VISLPLDVEADLHVELPSGARVTLRADGPVLRVDAPRWRDLLAAWRSPGRRSVSAAFLRAAHVADLTAHLSVRDVVLAELAPGARRPRLRLLRALRTWITRD
jgi:hypothetical protein